jgi:hypothetical protein
MIVVRVQSNLAVPGGFDTVRIVVNHAGREVQSHSLSLVGGRYALPLQVGLLSPSGGGAEVGISAIAERAGQPVVRAEAITTFIKGRSLVLDMFLAAECAGFDCKDPGKTCAAGPLCIDRMRPASALPAFDPRDAGGDGTVSRGDSSAEDVSGASDTSDGGTTPDLKAEVPRDTSDGPGENGDAPPEATGQDLPSDASDGGVDTVDAGEIVGQSCTLVGTFPTAAVTVRIAPGDNAFKHIDCGPRSIELTAMFAGFDLSLGQVTIDVPPALQDLRGKTVSLRVTGVPAPQSGFLSFTIYTEFSFDVLSPNMQAADFGVTRTFEPSRLTPAELMTLRKILIDIRDTSSYVGKITIDNFEIR